MLTRLKTLLRRRQRSRQFDIPFSRAASWQMPQTIKIAGQLQPLHLPADNGTNVSFINIFLDDCYGLEQITPPESVHTVLDIGAHAGMFSLYARSQFSLSIIHAYEPNFTLQSYLEHQATIGQFTYHLEAVGQSDGYAQLAINDLDSVQTRCRPNEAGNVKQVSFDRCIERLGGSVDLVKLDCEGAEWYIFQSTAAWKFVKHLTMEYHLTENYTQKDVIARVKELGFKVLKFTMDGPTWGILWATREAN